MHGRFQSRIYLSLILFHSFAAAINDVLMSRIAVLQIVDDGLGVLVQMPGRLVPRIDSLSLLSSISKKWFYHVLAYIAVHWLFCGKRPTDPA